MIDSPFSKKVVGDYVEQVAKKHGLSKKDTRTLLSWMMKNLTKMIERGEEVRIKNFGRFYFMKQKPKKKNESGGDLF